MDALGELSLADRAEAEIQAKVAEFLAMKKTLMDMRFHPALTIKSKAAALYATQVKMEGELTATLAKIQQMKDGAWSYSDVIGIGDFAWRLNDHMKRVRSLQQEAGGSVVVDPTASMYWLPIALVVGIGVWWVMR